MNIIKTIALSVVTMSCAVALCVPFVELGDVAVRTYKDYQVIDKEVLATSLRTQKTGYEAIIFTDQASCLKYNAETPFSKIGGCAVLESKSKLAHNKLVELYSRQMKSNNLIGFSILHNKSVQYSLPVYSSEHGSYQFYNGYSIEFGGSILSSADIERYNAMSDEFLRE